MLVLLALERRRREQQKGRRGRRGQGQEDERRQKSAKHRRKTKKRWDQLGRQLLQTPQGFAAYPSPRTREKEWRLRGWRGWASQGK
jgi:hypothetical protein